MYRGKLIDGMLLNCHKMTDYQAEKGEKVYVWRFVRFESGARHD